MGFSSIQRVHLRVEYSFGENPEFSSWMHLDAVFMHLFPELITKAFS